MSNSERKANLPAVIKTAESTFTTLARQHGVPDFTFEREAGFAIQILKDNSYLAEVACGNQDSLKEAIINVAAIGLSLSPVFKFAYLIPRKKKVCLDISYQGYVELAVSRGVLVWVKAVLVYDADEFQYQGVNKEPIHKCNPLANTEQRGNVIGGFVLAKTPAGDLLVEFMPIHEIYAIRDRSEAWKAYMDKKTNSTPWKSDENEMIKKTLIRRAQKSWPRSAAKEILERAVAAADDADGINFAAESLPEAQPDPHREEGLILIREFLVALDRTEDKFIEHLCRSTNRKITKLEDLTQLEVTQAVTFLEGVVADQAAKFERLKAKKETNENAS